MSLYGALFSGVSGLRSQSSKIGVISDNISNVNTVGYKGGNGLFQSLVTSSATSATYSPGGVLGNVRQTISKQGLLQSTDSPTDIAISGGGFFVVNQAADQTGQVLYSRAGSFRQDSTGNFRNAAGFFLQAWPLDREGRLPGDPGNLNTTSSANLTSLRTVNVQNLTGAAASTSSVAIGANLRASQTVSAGSGLTTTMDAANTINFGVKAKDLIVPSGVNGIARGDKFNVATGAGLNYTYRYGGYTFSRDVSNSSNGDNGLNRLANNTLLTTPTALTATSFSVGTASNLVTVTMANHGLITGDSATIAGNSTAVGNIPFGELNNNFVITKIDDDTFTIRTVTSNSAPAATGVGNAGTTAAAAVFTVTDASKAIRVRQVNHGLVNGAVVDMSGNTGSIAGIPSSELNGKFLVTVIDDDHYTFNSITSAASATLLATPFQVNNNSNLVTVTQAAHGFTSGQTVKLSGNAAVIGNIPAAELNNNFVITVVDANSYTIRTVTQNTVGAPATAGTTGVSVLDFSGGAGPVTSGTRPFTNNVLDASAPTQPFLGTTGTAGFTSAGLTFKVTTVSTGTVTFTYTSGSTTPQLGQFNNMNNLADAISAVNGLSARVVNNRLYVSSINANEAVTFTNGSTVGTAGPPVQAGIDWVRELGFANQAVGVDRFNTLEGLAALLNGSAGISAAIENPTGASGLRIFVDDPLDTISFIDRAVNTTAVGTAAFPATPLATSNNSNVITVTTVGAHGFTTGDIITPSGVPAGTFNGIPATAINGVRFEITVTSPTTYTFRLSSGLAATGAGNFGGTGVFNVLPPTNSGSLLAELGLVTSLGGGVFTAQSTGAIGPAYDPTSSTKNMASGSIPAQFSRPIRVFDSLGTGHDVSVNFIKTAVNTWAVEVFALPKTDVTTSLPDGLLTYGTITFNGDSSLRSVSTLLANPVNITWNNGAQSSNVTFNWGTAGQPFGTVGASVVGLTDGLSQFDSAYRVSFANQNGAPVGELSSVAIDENGFIIASYSNGQTQRLFKIPLADFSNPDQMLSISGNVFAETSDSGAVNLAQAGASGVGKISSSTLEASNVELADQLTDMIVAQRAYQANTKVISTADQLLEQLNQILR